MKSETSAHLFLMKSETKVKKTVSANQIVKHFDNESSFWISQRIKQMNEINLIFIRYQVTAFEKFQTTNRLVLREQFKSIEIFFVVIQNQIFNELCKAFIQPQWIPVFDWNKVAEPLVNYFMYDDHFSK